MVINDVCIVLAILAMTAVILGVGIGGRGSRYAITMIVVAMIRRREYKAREILPPKTTKAQFTEWVMLPMRWAKCSKEWDWFTGLNDENRTEWLQKVEGKKE